jgi:hypothetical protein
MSDHSLPLILNTFLALSVGALGVLALGSATADGYPSGAAVGYGQNPIVAQGGSLSGGSVDIFVAPPDQVIVVTDLLLSTSGSDGYSPCIPVVELNTSGGQLLGRFRIASYTAYVSTVNFTPANVSHSFVSGLPVPPGETLTISGATGVCTVDFSVSGYYAQP